MNEVATLTEMETMHILSSVPCPLPKPFSYWLCQLPITYQQQRVMLSLQYGTFPLRRLLVTWCKLTALSQWLTMTGRDKQVEYEFEFSLCETLTSTSIQGLWNIWPFVAGSCKTSHINQEHHSAVKIGVGKGQWSWIHWS